MLCAILARINRAGVVGLGLNGGVLRPYPGTIHILMTWGSICVGASMWFRASLILCSPGSARFPVAFGCPDGQGSVE